jgi:hypothetical protein
MDTALIALLRAVTFTVTIQTPWVNQHLMDLQI